jgi:hypothetical protein
LEHIASKKIILTKFIQDVMRISTCCKGLFLERGSNIRAGDILAGFVFSQFVVQEQCRNYRERKITALKIKVNSSKLSTALKQTLCLRPSESPTFHSRALDMGTFWEFTGFVYYYKAGPWKIYFKERYVTCYILQLACIRSSGGSVHGIVIALPDLHVICNLLITSHKCSRALGLQINLIVIQSTGWAISRLSKMHLNLKYMSSDLWPTLYLCSTHLVDYDTVFTASLEVGTYHA